MHPDHLCMYCKSYMKDYDDHAECRECGYYVPPVHKYKKKEEDPKARARREQQRHDRERDQAFKRIRVSKAITKVCSECEQEAPHDPDDYKCIVCRDGRSALPLPTFQAAA